MIHALFALIFLSLPAHAEGEAAGDFDYYVMSLSWTPTWCDLEGDARQSPNAKRGAAMVSPCTGCGRNMQITATPVIAAQLHVTRHTR